MYRHWCIDSCCVPNIRLAPAPAREKRAIFFANCCMTADICFRRSCVTSKNNQNSKMDMLQPLIQSSVSPSEMFVYVRAQCSLSVSYTHLNIVAEVL